jgi:hypothetical protein
VLGAELTHYLAITRAKHPSRWKVSDAKTIQTIATAAARKRSKSFLREQYKVEVFSDLITTVTDSVLEDVSGWQNHFSPGFAVSNQKRESERFLALNARHLRERSSFRSMWDNLPSFQGALDYGILGVAVARFACRALLNPKRQLNLSSIVSAGPYLSNHHLESIAIKVDLWGQSERICAITIPQNELLTRMTS